jgi:hypothetical protein
VTFSPSLLLSIAPRLAELLKDAVARYGDLRSQGIEVTPDVLALYLAGKTQTWTPTLAGKRVLDEETRAAMCRFLAGVAYNFCAG